MKFTITFLALLFGLNFVQGQVEDRIRLNKNTFDRRIANSQWFNDNISDTYKFQTFIISCNNNNYGINLVGTKDGARVAFGSKCQVEIHDKVFYIFIETTPANYPHHIYGFFTSKSELYFFLLEEKLEIEEEIFEGVPLSRMVLKQR